MTWSSIGNATGYNNFRDDAETPAWAAVIGGGILAAIGLATAPIWLPALAAKGAALVSTKGAMLTAGALVGAAEGVIAGKEPVDIAKKIAKNAAIGVAIEGPLEDWLKDLQQHVHNK